MRLVKERFETLVLGKKLGDRSIDLLGIGCSAPLALLERVLARMNRGAPKCQTCSNNNSE